MQAVESDNKAHLEDKFAHQKSLYPLSDYVYRASIRRLQPSCAIELPNPRRPSAGAQFGTALRHFTDTGYR
jgi:hypothetical protein